jgi:probable phosphoglycerate mutase
MGEWEGLSFADAEKQFYDLFWKWRTDIGNSRCPGGEKPGDAGDRMYTALRRIVDRHPGETVVIATHSVSIRALECRITKNGDYNEMKNVPYVQNASITEMEWDGDDVRYTLIGDESHLGDLNSTKFP